jgi:hypothetical protein
MLSSGDMEDASRQPPYSARGFIVPPWMTMA